MRNAIKQTNTKNFLDLNLEAEIILLKIRNGTYKISDGEKYINSCRNALNIKPINFKEKAIKQLEIMGNNLNKIIKEMKEI